MGNDCATLRQNLYRGECGISALQRVDTTDLPVTIGGEVSGLDPATLQISERASLRRMDLASQFAVYATYEALRDAGLPTGELGERVSVILGAGLSGMATLQEQTEKLLKRGPSRVSPADNSVAHAQRSTSECESRVWNDGNRIHRQ